VLDFGLLVAVAAAGGLGSIIRLLFARWSGWLPWGVLTANTIAAVIFLLMMSSNNDYTLIATTGISGGLSTFSAVVADAGNYLRDRHYLKASLNLLANLLVPVLACLLTAGVIGLLLN
jgi:CrcB protein